MMSGIISDEIMSEIFPFEAKGNQWKLRHQHDQNSLME